MEYKISFSFFRALVSVVCVSIITIDEYYISYIFFSLNCFLLGNTICLNPQFIILSCSKLWSFDCRKLHVF